MAYSKSPQALFWVDLETTGLPVGNDFSSSILSIMEVAVIVTDFDLTPYAGYTETIKLTKTAIEQLRANEYVRDMHKGSGLTRACVESTFSVADAESEIISMLRTATTFDKGEFMIAGSGVAQFDFPLIKEQMPELASWFAYYPFDIGIERRVSKILAGRDLVNPTAGSYGASKAHRAEADVRAHIEEAGKYREWLRSLV